MLVDDTLSTDAPFVAITRESGEARGDAVRALQQGLRTQSAIDRVPSRSNEFYLAIRKNELATRWFLSAYMKQYFPGGVDGGGAMSLGTRVVSFRTQNGKLFVFDVDNRKKASDIFDPQVVVDAYPIITNYEPFNRLPNSDQYVLVDPSAGLNDFDVVSDFHASASTPARFKVELSFLQRFRTIADGITFDEVFSGYSDIPDPFRTEPSVEPNLFRASGTLGIALRRYTEGDGFVPGPVATNQLGFEPYFLAPPRTVTNAGYAEETAIKWNIHPDMTPIKWLLSDKVNDVQAQYPQYDVIGALKAGIENWNDAFGFTALEADIATPDQSYADDDVNYFIYDTDPAIGYAFADWRTNPNTGEVRGASVYFNSLWIEYADQFFEADAVAAPPASTRRPVPSIRWKPMQAEPLCALEAPQFRAQELAASPLPAGLTKKEKVERFLTDTVLHEIGHTLGLRHNFKGSLVPPSTSVMDYLDDAGSIALVKPGSYDLAAVRYLYDLSTTRPTDAFCNDSALSLDPECNTFDQGDPFQQARTDYAGLVTLVLEGRYGANGARHPWVNFLAQFIRSGVSSFVKRMAFEDLIAQVKVDPARTPPPPRANLIDQWERLVLARLFLDPNTARGRFTADPNIGDSVLGPAIQLELENVLRNRDGIRSYESRRVMVDILKKVQTAAAHSALRATKAELEANRPSVPPAQASDYEDLIARIERAISPYYL
ncbi:MAG: zinc-dependent metalloprotease [Polyangiaceae bacterium]